MFKPSDKVLNNYAKVLVDFALWSGKGIKKGDVVFLQYETSAKPLALSIYKRILEKGGHPIARSSDESFAKTFYEVANDKQLEFFPKEYSKSLVDLIDHRISILSHEDPQYLKNIAPEKIMRANKNTKELRGWYNEKEDAGKYTWTLALYGTEGMAQEAGLSLKDYWKQINNACFLEEDDPVKKWKEVFSQINKIQKKLNVLKIETLHIAAKDTDLTIQMGEKRKWIGGSGRNIPSFEIFTSPDWRGTEGYITFDQPLYRYGNIIKDIRLEFKNGKVIKANASSKEDVLKEMIKQKDADKIGEYSLTDRRFSKISKFMANTLYDENFGGKYGNTHLAVGMSYHDTYDGDAKRLKDEDWVKLGFNDSSEHCDIIATTNRTVTATLKGGKQIVLYKDGEFQI